MTANNTARKRRTTMVPVTTMEEVPILTAKERAELLHALNEAEAEIKSGRYVEFDPKTFKDRLLGIRQGKKR